MKKHIYIGMIIIPLLVLFYIDIYVYQAIKTVIQKTSESNQKIVRLTYWIINITPLILTILYFLKRIPYDNIFFNQFIQNFIFISYITKIIIICPLLIEDIFKIVKLIIIKLKFTDITNLSLTRSVILSKITLITSFIPISVLIYGIVVGAHNYKVREVTIMLPTLPDEFNGIKIGHISDIHAGSFNNKEKVQRGVNMLINETPDIIFFTGDLVNNDPDEINDYIPIFKKLKAPLGVYSVLGNHDYGYNNPKKNQEQVNAIISKHKELGWNLLMNENTIIKRGNSQIAIIGVENWGKGRFPKYGNIDKAYQNTEHIPIKLLLSHDPSHWDEQITKKYQDINVTFAGHTHGGQVSIEVKPFKWSLVKYIYKQWAGLYKEGSQYLYVNRGFGNIGYLGRIGTLPEITIIKLLNN